MIARLLCFVIVTLAAAAALCQEKLIGEILVQGTKNVSQETILASMRTKAGQVYQQSQLDRDRQTVETLGYFQDVKIYGQLLQDDKWRVVVEVVEWPVITGVKIAGVTVFKEEEIIALLAEIGVKPGNVFNLNNVDKAAQAISARYQKEGFFARVNKFEPTAEDPGIIFVEVVEARVNKIIITGLKRTRESVVRKLFDTQEGDLLQRQKWMDDLRRVAETRWFNKVDPTSEEKPDQLGKVDLIVDVEEGRTGLFNVGVQLDPRNNLAGFITFQETNFRGTGKSTGINLLQSARGLGTSITLDYGDPFIDNRRSALNVSIYSRESLVFGSSLFGGGGEIGDGDSFTQRRTGASVALSRVLGRRVRGILGFRGERVTTNNFDGTEEEQIIVQDGDVVSLSFGIVQNRRDYSPDPAKGDYLKATIEPSYSNITKVGGAGQADILGANYFTKLTFDYRKYFSAGPERTPEQFNESRRVVAARLYGGAIGGKVPFFEQFFIGGANGVRGYAEDRFWGRNVLLAQVEYRHPLRESFNLIAFVDYGGAWNGYAGINTFTQSRNFELHAGYGIGLSFRTAFGPIRLDIGFGEDGKARTHFQIGGSF